MGYTKDIVHGVSWIGGLRFSTRIIAYIRIAILARILTPAQFGVFGIAYLILALIEIITETGINVFLVQEKNENEYINSAWIVSIVRGIVISLVILVLAPFVISFFNSPESLQVLLLISVVPVIRGFINPSVVKFQKNLEFRKEFIYKSFIFVVETFTVIIFALMTKSAICFAVGLIIGALLEVILSFFLVRPIPNFSLKLDQAVKIMARGKWITAAGVFNYLFHHGDDFVVGKILGVSSLGLYDVAYRISSLPISEVSDVVSRVAFPVYSKISDDNSRLKSAYIKTALITTLIVIPIGVIFFIIPEFIIKVVLGEQWIQASPVFQILTIYGVLRAISNTTSPLFWGIKKQEFVTIITFISFLAVAIIIIPLIQYFGIIGASVSVVIATMVGLFVNLYFLSTVFK